MAPNCAADCTPPSASIRATKKLCWLGVVNVVLPNSTVSLNAPTSTRLPAASTATPVALSFPFPPNVICHCASPVSPSSFTRKAS